LIGTGLGGCFWQIGFIFVGAVALFLPGSPYILYQDQECIANNSTLIDSGDNFWIRCPPGVAPPTSFVSVGVIFASAIFQRWGVYIFDMITTQLFQLKFKNNCRLQIAIRRAVANYFFVQKRH